MNNNEARYIEGYAAALQDAMKALTGHNGCDKHCDPMAVEEIRGIMHSHAISDYRDIREIKETLLDEACREIRADMLSNAAMTDGQNKQKS